MTLHTYSLMKRCGDVQTEQAREFDPSTRVIPARPHRIPVTPRSLTDGAEALLAKLDRLPAIEPSGLPDDLPVLRLVTVRVGRS